MALTLIGVWLLVLAGVLIFAVGRRQPSGAFTLAYFLALSLIHVPGLLPFIANSPVSDLADETFLGFEVTLAGMAAFLVGAAVVRRLSGRRGAPPAVSPLILARTLDRFGRWSIIVGGVSFLFLLPIAFRVPTLNSLFSGLDALLVLGILCWMYRDRISARSVDRFGTISFLPLLPAATLLSGGIINYGINWLICCASFSYSISRKKGTYLLLAPLIAVLGLSFFVAYMDERSFIREAVWEEHAGVSERIGRAANIFTRFHILNLNDPDDVDALYERLNFNEFIGVGAERLRQGQTQLKYGTTLDFSAMVPRALWPDKPFHAGGSDLVSEFTGIRFDANTSVGAGQSLEFYMNFGLPGVIVGFLALGAAFAWIDRGFARALAAGDLRSILVFGLPAINMISPGGNLTEIVLSVTAALAVALAAGRLPGFQRLARRTKQGTPGRSPASGRARAARTPRTEPR